MPVSSTWVGRSHKSLALHYALLPSDGVQCTLEPLGDWFGRNPMEDGIPGNMNLSVEAARGLAKGKVYLSVRNERAGQY